METHSVGSGLNEPIYSLQTLVGGRFPASGRGDPSHPSRFMKLPVALCMLLVVAGCLDRRAPPLFVLRAADETGITFANTLQEDDSLYNPLTFDYLYNGAGVAVGDLNNDGLLDLYFAGNMVSNRVYLNRGGLRFEDVTEAAGAATEVWSTGVSLVDINQDGLLDVYVCVAGPGSQEQRANLLYVNQGVDERGTPLFEEQARAYGIADTGYSTQAVFLDYDRDDDLDLYVLTNAHDDGNRNAIRPRYLDGTSPSTDRLYRNDGNGTFSDVSRAAGITIEGYGLGVAVGDIDQDGWPDIYAANDFITNDLLWINNRDGTFTNRAPEYLKHQTYNGMGVDIADYNNDARPDIVVLDMLPEDNHRQKMMLSGGSYDRFQTMLDLGYQPQYVRNTLQLNNGPDPEGRPSFSEIGQLAGIHHTDWSWAPLFADFDNDGLKDLFVSNGYRRDVTNLDFIARSNQPTMGADIDRRGELAGLIRDLPEVKIPNYVFRNRGDLTFEDRTRDWGLDLASYSTGAVYADLDGDGDLDLVINNLDETAFLYENRLESRENPGRYLRVAFVGPPGNRDAYGARVLVHAGGGQQLQEFFPTRGYKSTVEPRVHFGLGDAERVDSVEVYWPDGRYQLLTDIATDQLLRVEHRDAGPAPPPAAERPLLFRAASWSSGLAPRHVERELPDFKHTPLLPHKHSQGGPGLAVGDVDGNGLDDVYVGSDRGQPKELRLQLSPGRFATRLLDADKRVEDMGALFFDADGDGDLDLYVVSGGSFPVADEIYQDRLYVNDGAGRFERTTAALPEITASGSCVVAADYDRDGDLDLFVGGRIVPERYPLPARSYLLRNDSKGGEARFTDVTEQMAPGLVEGGLVTAALWSDFDRDGRPDLVIAGEWMPVSFYRNDPAGFIDVTGATGLPDTHGWWNSLIAGDFDNDGDSDYVAGNLGLNSMLRASPREPVEVHAADFDQNGSVDPVLSRYIQGVRYPIAFRDILIDQMAGMEGRFPRYVDYADATLEETLRRSEREGAYLARSVRLASSYLENLGGGRFALHVLPLRAQFSPVFGMVPGDFDGDGNLDVALVSNSHATEVQSGRYDASIGSVLLGDGRGAFRHLSGTESGFFVDGNARAVAVLLVGEDDAGILVTQNDAELRVFSAGAGGNRVRLRLRPLDEFALLTHADGRVRRQDLPYGSGYLSQSSRFLEVTTGVVEVTLHDARGGERRYRYPAEQSERPTAASPPLTSIMR